MTEVLELPAEADASDEPVERLPWNKYVFKRGETTYVAVHRATLLRECNVQSGTVKDWARRCLIETHVFKLKPPPGKHAPNRRSFVDKDRVLELRRLRDPASLLKQRTPTEIKRLDDDDYITVPEMESVGVPEGYARRHWDFPDKKRRRQRPPSPVIDRVIRTKAGPSVTARGQRRTQPLVRWGDVREMLHVRDNPPVPEGGVLVRDAVAKLRAIGINVGYSTLAGLVRDGVIGGDKVDSFRRNYAPFKLLWMKWEDRDKIPQRGQPGARRCWLDGEDWYPKFYEAWRLAGCHSLGQMTVWLPLEFGGLGVPCPHLGGKLVRCRWGPIPRSKADGDKMIVCAGEDLRTIAEALTGTRPKAPPRPKNQNGHASNGNGHPPRTKVPDVQPDGLKASPKRGRGERGRSPDTDPDFDRRVSEAWETRDRRTCKNYGDLAPDFDLKSGDDVKRAIDRHRKTRAGK